MDNCRLPQGMEPKLIKEENVEKEGAVSAFVEAPRTRKGSSKECCENPDSPEGARQAATPLSPSQSSPTRNPSNGCSSPINNGSADSLTPPLPASAALSISLENRTPAVDQAYTPHPPAYANARQLVKVKRFLSTLVQFGTDISQDVGERVRSLVLSLVSSNLSIEEFHHSLQDVTNFPLRSFVLPFLRTHLPFLQREIQNVARSNKQSPLQYIRTHEHVILDPNHSAEVSEIFMPNEAPLAGIKRSFENGVNGQGHFDSQEYAPPLKRPFQNSGSLMFSQHHNFFLHNGPSSISNSHFFDYGHGQSAIRTDDPVNRDEEWRNIHVMLNCILSMVEKTKRALTILQQRNHQEMTAEWLRKQDVSVDLKKAANEIMAQAVKQTEDRVSEVRKRAEDAVNDVKRQAVIELQKAVAVAETKANELVAAEKAKMEKLLVEARKHPEDLNNSNHEPADSNLSPRGSQTLNAQNLCWNCGRKAHETCSGCSLARYCGAFCQHKDWETHHQVCSKEKGKPVRITPPGPVTQTVTALNAATNELKPKK